MVLSDVDIMERVVSGELTIHPYEEDNVEPSSIDLRLGNDFKFLRGYDSISLEDSGGLECIEKESPILVPPGKLVLATTMEWLKLPNDICARVLGRSSLGRLGISVHQTAGYIDPGFQGEITLELSNHGPAPVELRSGDRICQIVFEELSSPALEPYGHEGSNYQNQSGATPSSMDFD